MADDRQTEARAAGVPAPRPVDAVEALEDAVEVAGRDADPVVGDHQLDPRDPRRGHAHLDARARLAVLDGVLDEVAERRAELAAIAADVDARRHARAPRWRCRSARRGGGRGRRHPRRRRRRRPGRASAPRRARSATARAGRRSSVDTRWASSIMRSATRWTTSRSSSSPSASASTASAPIGVFSSWLMLATKSVRTASTASPFADVLDRRHAPRRRRAVGGDDDDSSGRAEQLERLRASPRRCEPRRADPPPPRRRAGRCACRRTPWQRGCGSAHGPDAPSTTMPRAKRSTTSVQRGAPTAASGGRGHRRGRQRPPDSLRGPRWADHHRARTTAGDDADDGDQGGHDRSRHARRVVTSRSLAGGAVGEAMRRCRARASSR